MASTTTLLFTTVTLLLLLLQNTTVSARDLPLGSANIAARLQIGGITECWGALYELKSCTNEIIMFFLNGRTTLGVSCCDAVDIITTNCWPAILISLGFTTAETNVLRGYCQNPNPGGDPTPNGDSSSPTASPAASPTTV